MTEKLRCHVDIVLLNFAMAPAKKEKAARNFLRRGPRSLTLRVREDILVEQEKIFQLQIPAEVIQPGDKKFIINNEIRYHLWLKGKIKENQIGYVHIFATVSGGEKYWITGKVYSTSEIQKPGEKVRVDWITLGSPQRSYTSFRLMAVLLPEKLKSGDNLDEIPKDAAILSDPVTVTFNGQR